MKMSDKIYIFLKWFCIIFLPALSTAIFALGQLLHFPNYEIICGVIAIVGTFIGSLIKVSDSEYKSQIIAQNAELSDSGREDGVGEDGE